MFFQRIKSLVGVGTHVLKYVKSSNNVLGSSIGRGLPHNVERSLTRSMWHMCRRQDTPLAQPASFTKACQCCVHTEGDQNLHEFLKDEIKDEESTETNVPSVQGFELTKSGTCEVELTKTQDNETIVVSFNVNDSVVDVSNLDEQQQQQQQENAAPELLSRPPFSVDLIKGDDVLCVDVRFQDTGEMEMVQQDEDYPEDPILIERVTMMKKGEERNDDHFTLDGESMDPRMYDLLMDVLAERGITDKFAEELIDFSTTYEHKVYLSFLNKLKDFSSKK